METKNETNSTKTTKYRLKEYLQNNKKTLFHKIGFIILVLFVFALLIVPFCFIGSDNENIPISVIQLNETNDALLFSKLNHYIGYEDYVSAENLQSSAAFKIRSLEITNYKVKSGDSLGEIAKKFNVSIGTLISFNSISDVRKVRTGSELQIPSEDGIWYTVVSGDSLERIAKRNNTNINDICDINNLSSEIIRVGQKLFLPGAKMDSHAFDMAMGRLFRNPTVGHLTSPYGYRPDPFTGKMRMHNGIDIGNRMGTPIQAAMAGKVSWVDSRPKGYGNYVVVRHSNGYETLYAHMSRIDVKIGQWVEAGDQLGLMGSTGRSTGPHLHFTIFRNNVTLNPLNYVSYK